MSINKRTSRTKEIVGSKGSIVLEAALVMPVFIIVVFFFIYMVQMTLLTTQMNTLASNAVKLVSSHIYPVALAVEAHAKENVNETENASNLKIPKLSLVDWADQYAADLPSPLNEWIREAAVKGDEPLQDLKNSVLESVLDPVMKPLLHPFLEGTLLHEERLHVSRVTVPDLRTGSNPYFGIEISYELPVKVPFTNRKLVLQSRAEERLWIGDTGELNENAGEGEVEQGQHAVILSKPDPAYAGHKAKVSAKIEPFTTAKLTVYYKSGTSKAKYLGEATADASGIVDWEWLVGGNTTPGTWTIVLETQEGLRTTEVFDVVSPNNK
ncbi:pilus assembly protein [Paenibacillus sp. FSL K6-2524]|uniref:pilus assembly protein n=1 Tax=Paenibacillus sp. FSL K6-2524 TaxID=2954516 RepID=UPI0030F4F0C4